MHLQVWAISATVAFLITDLAAADEGMLNQYCDRQRDCVRNFGYICSQNRTCQCDRWYIPNKMKDSCVGGVGQRCKYDDHCIEGAFCEFQSKCKCKESLYASDNGMACSSSNKLYRNKLRYTILTMLLYVSKII